MGGGGGNGPAGNVQVYQPQFQGQSDQAFWSTLQPLIGQAANAGAGTPAGLYYPQAQVQYANLLDPLTPGTWGNKYYTQAVQGAQQGAGIGTTGAGQLASGAQDILGTAFDPQSALFNQTQQQVQDQAAAANAMAGIGGTPYGASVQANALQNFDLNWQNQQLARQRQGLASAGTIYPEATNLAASAGGLPYSTATTAGTNALQGLGSVVNMGNNQYLLPQQVLGDITSYLGVGQNATALQLQQAQLEQQNRLAQQQMQASAFGGIGSALGSIAPAISGS